MTYRPVDHVRVKGRYSERSRHPMINYRNCGKLWREMEREDGSIDFQPFFCHDLDNCESCRRYDLEPHRRRAFNERADFHCAYRLPLAEEKDFLARLSRAHRRGKVGDYTVVSDFDGTHALLHVFGRGSVIISNSIYWKYLKNNDTAQGKPLSTTTDFLLAYHKVLDTIEGRIRRGRHIFHSTKGFWTKPLMAAKSALQKVAKVSRSAWRSASFYAVRLKTLAAQGFQLSSWGNSSHAVSTPCPVWPLEAPA